MTQPSFPDPGPVFPEFVYSESTTFAHWATHHRQHLEHQLSWWRQLGPLYAHILAATPASETDDDLKLDVAIEEWPTSFDAQQQALTALLDGSQLRQAWRRHAHWLCTEEAWHREKHRDTTAALDAASSASARPLREIPLYHDSYRISCQQLICLPISQWQALHAADGTYAPERIDSTIIDKLATRIARTLNEPVLEPGAASSRWLQVWDTTPLKLTLAGEGNGMTDHHYDEYMRPKASDPGRQLNWRFDGFYGRLRISGVGAEPWMMVVLAPMHFLEHLGGLIRGMNMTSERRPTSADF